MTKEVLIVTNQLITRTGISIVLKEQFEIFQIFYADHFLEAIDILNKRLFDLAILDVDTVRSKNNELIENIRAIQPNIKILIFSYEEDHHALKYFFSKADGYLNKFCSEKKMIWTVTSILEGEKCFPTGILTTIQETWINQKHLNPFDNLSKREFEIAKLLITGIGNLEISNILNIHTSTVSTYKVKVFKKLKVHNLVELISIYNSYNISYC